MSDIQITEDQFTLPDGYKVYRKTWAPSGRPVAKLIHIHGYSDHINRYYDLFPSLANRGILCTGIDQRGWGRSVQDKADRGNTGATSQVISDIAAFIESYLPSDVPVFLMGHSMGGQEVLTMASTPQYKSLLSKLQGVALESPYVALPPVQSPGMIKVFLGRLAGRLLPHHQILNEMDVKTIVRDPEVQQSVKDDPLCHNTGTLEMFSNMLDRSAQLDQGKLVLVDGAIKALWLAHGTGDQCTSHDASKKWFDSQATKIQDREFKSYDGWSHQLHCDTPENREVFAADLAAWILKRSGTQTEQAKL